MSEPSDSLVPSLLDRLELTENSSLLDISRKVGSIAHIVKYQAKPIFALREDRDFVNKARRDYPLVHWIRGDLENMPFRDGAFTHVIYQGFESLTQKTLEEVYRVLSEGGTFILIAKKQ